MKRVLVALAVCLVSGLVSVPSAQATIVDLMTAGASGTINGALFYQTDPTPTGTGNINSFLRIRRNITEQGYNTDGGREFHQVPGFTRSLLLSDVPVVTIGETQYREFGLDINERNSCPAQYLSLDRLQFWLGATPDLDDYSQGLGDLIYDMDAAGNSVVALDAALGNGSGSGDMLVYVPNSLFTSSNPYLYLFSRFGDCLSSDGGFEEWWVRDHNNPVTPEPATLSLLGLGLASLGLLRRRRRS